MAEFKKGDKVVLTDKYFESESRKGEVFEVLSDPKVWNEAGAEKTEVVFLGGSLHTVYATDGLEHANEEQIKLWEFKKNHGFLNCKTCAHYRRTFFSGTRTVSPNLFACIEPESLGYVAIRDSNALCANWTDKKGRTDQEAQAGWLDLIKKHPFDRALEEFSR